MESPKINLPPDDDLEEVRKPTSLLIAQFFLFPLIIIAICAGIFLFFGYLSYDVRTPEQYLTDIRSGSETQRWQAAFELSSLVKSNPEAARTPQFAAALIKAYKDSPDTDIRVRGFVALMLGHLRDKEAVPELLQGLDREERLKSAEWETGIMRPSLAEIQENLIQSQIYTLWALGSIGDNAAVPGVLARANSEDPSTRKMVAYVLGVLKDSSAIPALRVMLNDAREDVCWNAALALAQMGNNEGAELLMKLLDPAYVQGLPGITPELASDARVNAVTGLGMLRYEPAREKIAALSQSDLDLPVRNAALEAIKKF
jgi:HEAT repeat protein